MNIGRSFDIDDILLNLIGGIIGHIIYILFSKFNDKLPNILKKEWVYNIIWILILIAGTIFIFNYYGIWEVL